MSSLKELEQQLQQAYARYNQAREEIQSLNEKIAAEKAKTETKPKTTIARYAYRAYNSNDEPVGWLITHSNGEIAHTQTQFKWCKQWKTEGGARKSFDGFNRQFGKVYMRGGYLKIELLVYDI